MSHRYMNTQWKSYQACQALSLSLALLVFAGSGLSRAEEANSFLGAWEGAMGTGRFSMRMVLKISETEDGGVSASMSYPDRGVRDLPVNAILFNGSELLFEFDQFGGAFRGAIDESGEQISGAWESGNRQGPPMAREATFKRVTIESTEPAKLDFELSVGEPEIKGYWKTNLKVNADIQLAMLLRIGTDPEGELRGLLDIPDQGTQGIPVTDLKYDSSQVVFSVKGMGMDFEGRMNSAATAFEGTMKSFGQEFELVFDRASAATEEEKLELSYNVDSGETDMRGFWQGTLTVPGAELRLAVALGVDPEGVFHGTMDSLDQNARGLPMSSVEVTERHFEFKWAALGATYSGDLSEDRNELVGSFKQGPIDVPFTMLRQSGPPESK